MNDLDKLFNGVSNGLFNNAGMQFIDFPPEDLEPGNDSGVQGTGARCQTLSCPPVAVPASFPPGFHGGHIEASEQKPCIPIYAPCKRRTCDRPLFATKTPHFFKLILEDSIQYRSLEIPVTFVHKHFSDSTGIASSVVLEVPSGEKWEVELSKSNGKTWLQHGWKEFADHYSLKDGYLVVFRYEGHCQFHVLIFDATSIEIEYPRLCTKDDDSSIQILNKPSACCKRTWRSSEQCNRPYKLRKNDSTQETEVDSNSDGFRSRPQCQKESLSCSKRLGALERERSFKANEPFFTVVMQPSHVKQELNIPSHFFEKHLKVCGQVTLRVSDGRTWTVSCLSRRSKGLMRYRFKGNWKAFARDNNLQVGDFCVFELIKGEKSVFNVINYSGDEGTSAGCQTPACLPAAVPVSFPPGFHGGHIEASERKPCIPIYTACKRRACDRPLFVTKLPHFFKLILEDSIQDGRLEIPATFAHKQFSDRTGIASSVVLEVPSGEKWEVELSKSNGKMWLQHGWKEFAEHYPLKYGYLVVFRYEGHHEFHILIFDATSIEIEYPRLCTEDDDSSIQILNKPSACCKRTGRLSEQCNRPYKVRKNDSTQETELDSNSDDFRSRSQCQKESLSCSKRLVALERTVQPSHSRPKCQKESFKANEPFFTVVMQPSHVKQELNIPSHFFEKHLKVCGQVTLRVSDGRTWTVSCLSRRSNGLLRYRFKGNWRAFVRDNNLQVGDVCVFELIKAEKILFNVINLLASYANPPSTSSDNIFSYPQATAESSTYKERTRALEKTRHFMSNEPFFTIVMQQSHLTTELSIPSCFVEKHFKGGGQVTLRGSDGRTWTACCTSTLTDNGQLRTTLKGSWIAFVRDNNLQVGDVCVFELVKGEKPVFNVTILSASDVTHSMTSCY